jgi:acyl-CoA thioesterase-1
LYFASGESFYPGAAVLLLAIAGDPFLKHQWLSRLRNVLAWLALTMIVMACPPLPWVVDAIFAVTFLMWYLAANSLLIRRAARPTSAILATLLIVLSVIELRHRNLPAISGATCDHLVVIGDSVSAGLDPRVPPWPAVMEKATGIPIKNLSSVGAFTTEGLRLAAQVAPEDQVVLIEIGGNDLIAGGPSSEFGRSLEGILQKVAEPGRTVVMFELPLLPDRVAYGQIQRRLAKKYGVWLIPKRYFTYVISGANATSDGLHLLPEGTRRMATLVTQVLTPVLKVRSPAV